MVNYPPLITKENLLARLAPQTDMMEQLMERIMARTTLFRLPKTLPIAPHMLPLGGLAWAVQKESEAHIRFGEDWRHKFVAAHALTDDDYHALWDTLKRYDDMESFGIFKAKNRMEVLAAFLWMGQSIQAAQENERYTFTEASCAAMRARLNFDIYNLMKVKDLSFPYETYTYQGPPLQMAGCPDEKQRKKSIYFSVMFLCVGIGIVAGCYALL